VFTDDALLAVFCRGQARGNAAIFRGTRADERTPWAVERLELLDTPFSDCSPWITADGSELWFASAREGGAGGNDVWLVPMDGGDPGSPEPVVELNTDVEDDDPWLSPDGSTIVFASDRNEAGDVDLFIAVRTAM
jgi:Tol biopolymer transport system component